MLRYNRWKYITKEQFETICKECKSIACVAKSVGYKKCAGGAYSMIKKYLQLHNTNTDHWTGHGWNKGQQQKNWSEYTTKASYKKHLIKLRGHICEACELSEWIGKPIPIEIHHIDGNRANNSLDNLELLCPNCHAMTDNWRGRNIQTDKKYSVLLELPLHPSLIGCNETPAKKPKIKVEKLKHPCKICQTLIIDERKFCSQECYHMANRKVVRPSFEQLKEDVRATNTCAVGRKYGVSDNCIRKWLKSYSSPTSLI